MGMDYNRVRIRKRGEFDAIETLAGPIQDPDSKESTPDFVTPNYLWKLPIHPGLGEDINMRTPTKCIL